MINQAFHEFFAKVYGERWPSLYAALEKPSVTREFFCAPGMPPYFMDEASVLAAQSLPFAPNARVLDLCAAPGGKTLVLASKVGPGGSLLSNERSATRRERLKRVIDEHVPASIRAQIKVTSHDASKWCLYEKDAYDAILLDAPCSSERHLIHQPNLLKEWTPNRSKFLAQRQYAMLASTFAVVAPGGHVLYSTCSISPLENDGVIDKLLKKKKGQVEVKKLSLAVGEATTQGWMILPDTSGLGPMYFSLIRRTD
jgi:16S rRNA C967 or C1407 C5-methylase (RsmB/RsmF family)